MPRSRLGPGTPGQTRPEPGYIEATYYIETHIDVQQAAQAIADEQSTGIGQLGARGRTRGLQPWTARVVLLEDLGSASDNTVVPYALDKPLYASAKSPGRARAAQIRIAYPIANISTSIVDLWNTVGGEVHRQGYLTTARLIDVHFPNGYLDGFAGPRYGLAGI